jgi:ATP-dependent helicase/nuclease subunit B
MIGLQKTKGNKSPTIYTIPCDQDFLKILAKQLLEKNTPYELAQYIIFLPTQRACKKLEEELLNLSTKKSVLLPRLVPLGQVEEDEIILSSLEGSKFGLDLPPVISNEKRQIILAKIIFEFYKNQNTPIATSKASQLAIQLAQLIDQIEMEGLNLENLENLVPQNYAMHWQTTLDFLKIIKVFWPHILANEKVIEFKKYHRLLIEKLIQQWQETPPENPIIIAGSTGSIPSTANLIKTVCSLDKSFIILPGFDKKSSSVSDESNPQNTMLRLLEKIGIAAEDILLFPGAKESETHSFLSSVFRNQSDEKIKKLALNYIACNHEQEEAAVVATAIRYHLEDQTKTIQVITPDRNLAERIINELNKWKINTNDSGGKPLRRTPLGSFVLLTTSWLNAKLNAVDFLATLKHPYAQKYKFLAQALERYYFRSENSPVLPYQISTYQEQVLEKIPDRFHDALKDFIAELSYIKQKINSLSSNSSLSDFLRMHQTIIEWLIEDTFESSEKMGPTSQSQIFNQLWQNLYKEGHDFALSDLEDYSPFLESFLLQIKVRPHKSLHPRVHILGLIESRLMRSDVVILAGLNEGTWPPEPKTDPWFSQSMRAQFGLPSHERRIGLSCLDFMHACGNKEVLLTRSMRVNGTPSIPSRFLLKLENGLQKSGLQLERSTDFLDYVRFAIEEIRPDPISAPEPKPVVKDRPRKLSVTEIEVLLKDPYSIYAKHILKLKPLNDLTTDFGTKEFGILLHKIFHLFIKKQPINIKELFEASFQNSMQKEIWWIRIQRAYDWFLKEIKNYNHKEIHTEIYGELTFKSIGGNFLLTAIADRIDIEKNSAEIIDYKTGYIPLPKNIRNGHAAQLPLEGIILKEGGFKNIKNVTLSDLIFWQVTGKEEGEIFPIKDYSDDFLSKTYEGLKNLIGHFDQSDTPYRSHPHGIEGYGSYNHLSRIKEWIN